MYHQNELFRTCPNCNGTGIDERDDEQGHFEWACHECEIREGVSLGVLLTEKGSVVLVLVEKILKAQKAKE